MDALLHHLTHSVCLVPFWEHALLIAPPPREREGGGGEQEPPSTESGEVCCTRHNWKPTPVAPKLKKVQSAIFCKNWWITDGVMSVVSMGGNPLTIAARTTQALEGGRRGEPQVESVCKLVLSFFTHLRGVGGSGD